MPLSSSNEDTLLLALSCPAEPGSPGGPVRPFSFQEIADVPLGHCVPKSCRTKTWLPLTARFAQHPCITSELSTGLGLVLMAAVAMPVPVPRASVAAPAMRNLNRNFIISLPDGEGQNKRHGQRKDLPAYVLSLLLSPPFHTLPHRERLTAAVNRDLPVSFMDDWSTLSRLFKRQGLACRDTPPRDSVETCNGVGTRPPDSATRLGRMSARDSP